MESNIPIEVRKVYVPVPVEKELPDEGQWVCILVDGMGEMVGRHYSGVWKALYAEGPRDCAPEDKVTHWLKAICLPEDWELRSEAVRDPQITSAGFMAGANHILNLLKTPQHGER